VTGVVTIAVFNNNEEKQAENNMQTVALDTMMLPDMEKQKGFSTQMMKEVELEGGKLQMD